MRTKYTKAKEKHFGLYRAILSCQIAEKTLDRTSTCPKNVTPQEYALYNLSNAISEIANYLSEQHQEKE